MWHYTSEDFNKVYCFNTEEDAHIREMANKGVSYVAIAVGMFLQPSLVYTRGRELGVFGEEHLHTIPTVDHEGVIQLPPIPDVQKITIWDYPKHGVQTAWVPEHYWQEAISRGPLKKGMQVFHINMCKLDNRADNLCAFTLEKYVQAQKSLHGILVDLVESKRILFDREHGRYELTI